MGSCVQSHFRVGCTMSLCLLIFSSEMDRFDLYVVVSFLSNFIRRIHKCPSPFTPSHDVSLPLVETRYPQVSRGHKRKGRTSPRPNPERRIEYLRSDLHTPRSSLPYVVKTSFTIIGGTSNGARDKRD